MSPLLAKVSKLADFLRRFLKVDEGGISCHSGMLTPDRSHRAVSAAQYARCNSNGAADAYPSPREGVVIVVVVYVLMVPVGRGANPIWSSCNLVDEYMHMRFEVSCVTFSYYITSMEMLITGASDPPRSSPDYPSSLMVFSRWKILSADASAEQDDYNRAFSAKEKGDMEGWLKSLQEVQTVL